MNTQHTPTPWAVAAAASAFADRSLEDAALVKALDAELGVLAAEKNDSAASRASHDLLSAWAMVQRNAALAWAGAA